MGPAIITSTYHFITVLVKAILLLTKMKAVDETKAVTKMTRYFRQLINAK